MKTVRHSATIMLLVLAFMTNSAHASDVVISCPPANSDVFYYPERAFDAQYDDMDKSFRQGFTEHLAAMKEPSLSCGSASERETYRLLFVPAFNHPVVIRVTNTTSGIVLESTELSGEGGYAPGAPIERKRIQLSEGDWKELKTAITASMFWSATTSSEALIGIDGDRWIIEGRKSREYHAVGRFHPKGTSFGDLGQIFFKLAGIVPQGLD
jgi:hypothetical protein